MSIVLELQHEVRCKGGVPCAEDVALLRDTVGNRF